ncbi:MAG: hypothetical protein ACR2P5_01845, partial [Gammaproteobacteria bacterium]
PAKAGSMLLFCGGWLFSFPWFCFMEKHKDAGILLSQDWKMGGGMRFAVEGGGFAGREIAGRKELGG